MSRNGQHGEHLEDVCMAAMPDVAERLRLGGRVAELGSHVGRSSIDLAREFPRALVDAVSENQADIDAASSEASRAGLAGRVVFHVAPPDEAPLAGPYDLVVAFDGRDDFAHSLRTLRRMRHLAAPSGTVVVAAAAGDDALVDAVYARAAGFSKVDLLPVPAVAGRLFRLTP
jgi:predicted O-methyltransferase YrrM